MQFQILEHKEINKLKWDKIVSKYANQPIYNCSSYLDVVSAQWKAVIFDDYKVILALPIKEKLGITLVNTPAFVQQLQIIGEWAEEYEKAIVDFVMLHFKLIDLNLNVSINELQPKMRTNLILSLNKPYQQISAQYSTLCKRNLKKAQQYNFILVQGVDTEVLIRNFASFYQGKINYTAAHLQTIIQFASQYPEKVATFGVQYNQEMVYQCLCLKDDNRIYYLISAPTRKGIELKATYWCLDQIIRQFAMQNLIFDFEGSDIEDVAFYYTRFGAWKEPYYNYKQNTLPWGVKHIIKQKLGY